MEPKLSVVMPVFNERATVQTIVQRVLASKILHELIIVDDGSNDGTRDLLAGLDDPRVQVLLHEKNMGKGAALRTGFEKLTGNLVIIQDADLEYSPEEYPELIDLIVTGRADVVFGSRFLGRHRVFLFTHYLGNKIINLVANILYNTILTDLETGFKAMRAETAKWLDLKSNGFAVEPEITAKIFKRKLRVYEIPITYEGRTYEEGKKIRWTDGLGALWALVKFRFVD